MNPLKICQIPDGTSTYPPEGADTSAWETHRLSSALTAMGQRVTVITLAKPNCNYPYDVVSLSKNGYSQKNLDKLAFAWMIYRNFDELFTRKSYDLIHFHALVPASSVLSKLQNRIPTVMTWGDPYLPLLENPDWKKYIALRFGQSITERIISYSLQKYVVSKVSVILAVSFNLKTRLVKLFGLPEWKVKIVPPGVDTSVFRPGLQFGDLMARHRIRQESKVVMCPARITPLKNQAELIRALSQLKIELKTAKLLFVGALTNEQYHRYLIKLSKELGLANDVIFTGPVQPEDFPRYYNMADVVVLPSISEGLPSSLLESMSCGRPTLASDIPSNIEVGTNMEDIVYYKLFDINDLVCKIKQILVDREWACRIANNARLTAQRKYDWSHIANSTLQIYLNIVTGSNS